jgi:hypothetical protein
MNDTDMQSKLGSLNAPTLLKIKPDEMYYEKVVSYSNCKPRYYYNVWVLLKMQKQDFTKAQDEAIAYLQKAQREEKAKKPQPLLPNPKIEFSNKTPIKESTTLIEKKIDLNSLPKDLYKTDRYNNRIHDNNPHNADTKNWSKTKTLWVVAGILAVGAVTGAVFATQGGSGGSSATGNLSPTPSTGGIISISAPVPK